MNHATNPPPIRASSPLGRESEAWTGPTCYHCGDRLYGPSAYYTGTIWGEFCNQKCADDFARALEPQTLRTQLEQIAGATANAAFLLRDSAPVVAAQCDTANTTARALAWRVGR